MTKMSQMTICRRICIFLILVAHHLLNAAESTRETCYRKTDSELATSGYCSSSCITGSFGPSANSKCKNSEKCCVPKLKTKVGSIVWNFFCLGGGGGGGNLPGSDLGSLNLLKWDPSWMQLWDINFHHTSILQIFHKATKPG